MVSFSCSPVRVWVDSEPCPLPGYGCACGRNESLRIRRDKPGRFADCLTPGQIRLIYSPLGCELTPEAEGV